MTSSQRKWHEFATPEILAATLAGRIVDVLADAIKARGKALLAVSGGTTPVHLFKTLSGIDLDWRHVTITLVDERFVPPTSPRSNEGLVRADLLRGKAAAANFIGLYQAAPTVEEAAEKAETALSSLPYPFDFVVLGMGPDGHTASFFPDDPDLARPLDLSGKRIVLPVHAQSAGEPRLTFSLPRLIEARHLALHIEGVGKKEVLEKALGGGQLLPIRAVFDAAKEPVDIYWAPKLGEKD
ncbi:MAG: 6-phosphogluconolactonase [Hyphomicrobiales bacterium]|nr:6-phosphogluconolactonase [Hyphomicrobiales bacterium]